MLPPVEKGPEPVKGSMVPAAFVPETFAEGIFDGPEVSAAAGTVKYAYSVMTLPRRNSHCVVMFTGVLPGAIPLGARRNTTSPGLADTRTNVGGNGPCAHAASGSAAQTATIRRRNLTV